MAALNIGFLFLVWSNSSFLAMNASNTCLLVDSFLVTMWIRLELEQISEKKRGSLWRLVILFLWIICLRNSPMMIF